MSPFAQRVLLWSGCACAVVLFGGLTLSVMARPTNCGGNSFALYNCRHIALLALTEMDGGRTSADAWAVVAKGELAKRGKNHWTGDALYLVRTNLTTNLPPTTIVAICSEPFGNVPQPMWWNLYRRNPAHAVARMDGRAGLISPADFSRLPLSDFAVTTNFAGIILP